MRRSYKFMILLALAMLLLTGCMRTVDQMYCLPKRSEEFQDLQTEMDKAMIGMEYCAPLAGDNQQAVQLADLNGDGQEEYLLFAKSDSEHPLRIMIFQRTSKGVALVQTIEGNGIAFDQVEYVQMDDEPGLELVFGSQLANQVLRSVLVYSFSDTMEGELLVSTSYTKFLTADLDGDALRELFILRPGQSDTDNGIAEVYGVEDGVMERTNEVNMSLPVGNLKRILTGDLNDGHRAVYVASIVDETALITDVYTILDEKLANISLSSESGTSVKTLRNYYIYADDIDNDGVIELPSLIPMKTVEENSTLDRHQLIRWFSLTGDGEEVDKSYTYHNLVGGWYLELQPAWASRLMVLSQGSNYEFYVWDEAYESPKRLLTIYILTDQDRQTQAMVDGRFPILSTDTVTFAATLEPGAIRYALTEDTLIQSFKLIQQDWKTGET